MPCLTGTATLALQPEYHAWLRQKYGSLDADQPGLPGQRRHVGGTGTGRREREPPAGHLAAGPRLAGVPEDAEAGACGALRSRCGCQSVSAPGRNCPPTTSGRGTPQGSSRAVADPVRRSVRGQAAGRPTRRPSSGPRASPLPSDRHGRWRRRRGRTFLERKQKDPATALTERIPAEERVGRALEPVRAERLSRSRPSGCCGRKTRGVRSLRQRYGTIAALNQRLRNRVTSDFDDVQLPWAVFKYDCFLRETDGLRRRYVLAQLHDGAGLCHRARQRAAGDADLHPAPAGRHAHREPARRVCHVAFPPEGNATTS